MIGAFGDFIFEVSAQRVRTFHDLSRKRSAVFAEHAVLEHKPRLQFTGLKLDEVGFSVKRGAALGLVVEDELEKLAKMIRSGKPYPLIIGDGVIGDFVLIDFDEKWENVGAKGTVGQAAVTLTLKEVAK